MATPTAVPAGSSVLVIQANDFARQLFGTMLTQMGFARVLTAGDYRSGLEQALETQPDLILLDWEMPGKNGADILRVLTACEHPFERSAVMVTNARATKDAIVRAARLGAAGFIVQPFTQKTLASRVCRILERRGDVGAPAAGGSDGLKTA